MKRSTLFASLAVLVTLLNGCASIVSGTDQKVSFDSEPEGATISIAGREIGKTPLTTSIDKDQNLVLSFQKKGYKEHSARLSTSLNSWFWGNIVFGGFLGSTTDNASGAMYQYSPDQYFVTLTPQNPSDAYSDKPRKIKELFLTFGDQIRLDLNSGGGENTEILLDILEIKDSEKRTTLKALKKLASRHDDDIALAEAIIDFYGIE